MLHKGCGGMKGCYHGQPVSTKSCFILESPYRDRLVVLADPEHLFWISVSSDDTFLVLIDSYPLQLSNRFSIHWNIKIRNWFPFFGASILHERVPWDLDNKNHSSGVHSPHVALLSLLLLILLLLPSLVTTSLVSTIVVNDRVTAPCKSWHLAFDCQFL